MYRTFSGKVLLFGEYSVFTGSKALVLPLKRFSGRLSLRGDQRDKEVEESNRELGKFLRFLVCQHNKGKLSIEIDIAELGGRINDGLYFQSNIPQQYGVGSSAALVAAVYDAFVINKASAFSVLKLHLSEMESYFHGSSSGIDPLCSYTGKTLLVDKESFQPREIPNLQNGSKFFLLDTGSRSETGTLVEDFKTRISEDRGFANIIHKDLNLMVDQCIQNIYDGSASGLQYSLRKLSDWQLINFKSMIPKDVRITWIDGLESSAYTLKLCGSGGGGFILGYTDQWENTSSDFRKMGKVLLALDL